LVCIRSSPLVSQESNPQNNSFDLYASSKSGYSVDNNNDLFPMENSFLESLLDKQSTTRGRGKLKKNCFKQTCTQVVAGRNLSYKRALQIVQDEEYLTATDNSIIKRFKRANSSM
jgi:hypothetical protein